MSASVETIDSLRADIERSHEIKIDGLRTEFWAWKTICDWKSGRKFAADVPPENPPTRTLRQVELEYVREVVIFFDGKIEKAARLLAIPEKSVREKYDIIRRMVFEGTLQP